MDRVRQRRQSCGDIFTEMDAQRAPATLRQHSKIAARLRCFHDAKGVLLPRNEDVHRVVARDLQKNAGIGTAFVGLSRGVQETRAKAEDSGDFFVVTHGEADGLERLFMRFVHGDVAERGKIVPGADAREMFLQKASQSATALKFGGIFNIGVELQAVARKERRFGRELAAGFIFGGQLARFHLAGLDVGLIEGINADQSAGHRCGHFPAEELLAEVVDVG
jgi:hypothetical protein